MLLHLASLLPPNHILNAARAALFAMSLTLSDVKRIANLAQLDMDDDQAETALDELNGIFALVEQMQAVDTSGVEPLSHPIAADPDAAAAPARRRGHRAEPPRRLPGAGARKPRTACTWCRK